MFRIRRRFLIDPADVGVYHCINRCVRRAFLCGTGEISRLIQPEHGRQTKLIGDGNLVREDLNMRFHAAILAPDGHVSAKQCRDGDKMQRDAVNRKMMDEFQNLLREKLTDDPSQTGKFRARFGDVQHILEWQQVEPLSAMGKFYVRGRIAAASFFLHGFAPEMDAAVLEATEVLFEGWFGGARKAAGACRGLRSIKERPVVIALPGDKKHLSPADWQIIGNLCPCFAAVFFARAEAFIKKVDEFGQSLGLRKMASAPDPLRN